MSVAISGILLDPYGNPAPFAEVKFITWQGANDVLTTSLAVYKTSSDGAYSFAVENGTFTVQVRYNQSNGKFETIKKKVIVNSETTASTLGELLLFNEPLTPPEIEYVKQLVAEAEGYRDETLIYRNETEVFRDEAGVSASEAEQSAIDAANSAAAIVGVPLNGGVWAAGQTFTAYNQYMIYNGIPYAPLTSTTLPYGPVGATPEPAFVGPYPLNDHERLSNLNAVGGHDAIYRRKTTAAQVASNAFSEGSLLEISDKRSSKFNVITTATPADNLKTLPAGDGKVAQAVGNIINVGTETIETDNFVLIDGETITGNGQFVSTLKSSTVNSNIFTMSAGQADTKIKDIKLEGLGRVSATNENGVFYQGNSNCRRNGLENVAIYDFSGSGADFSAGWSNYIRNTAITSCGVGLGFTQSPLLPGWAGSGFLAESSYIATCDVGVSMDAIWNFTSINTVIEDCDLPINQIAGGSPAVWINTWLESNQQSPRLAQSNIFIGGRLEGGEAPATPFYGNMSLPTAPFDYQCITELLDGLRVFRDPDDEVFAADGQGVKAFKPHSSLGWDIKPTATTAKLIQVGFGSNAVGGGIISESNGNDAAVWKDITQLTGARHFTSNAAANMPKMGVKVQGQGSSSLTGLGFVRTVFSSGIWETGGAGASNHGDRWQVHEAGHFSPLDDAAFDIGFDASSRVRDLRIVNAPIVGSDVRIKDNVASIPQELLDFALSVEIKQYKLKGRERTHYGIVITPEFLAGLSKVVALDRCAAFCHDVFKDQEGNPVTSEINTVQLGDLWQVRYDEWQNILLEAMRRNILAM